MNNSVYDIITERMIALLQAGTVPWHKSWIGGNEQTPRNLASGKPYRGINVFLLGSAGYSSPYWVSYKQASERGGQVRKGEKSTPAIFWKLWRPDKAKGAPAPAEGEESRRIPLLRYYSVFNVEQCDGLEYPKPAETANLPAFDPIATAQGIADGMPKPPTITHNEARAYYRPVTDTLNMPKPELFGKPAEYYSVLFHEMTHATGHAARLGRPGVTELAAFGSPTYAREELVAEMGAAFLCGQAGILHHTADNSAAYLENWIKSLRGDSKLVVIAAAQAQKAVDYITRQLETTSGEAAT